MMKVKQTIALTMLFLLLLSILPIQSYAAYDQPMMRDGTSVLHAQYTADSATVFENPDAFKYQMYNRIVTDEGFVRFGGVWDRDHLYIVYENCVDFPLSVTLNGVLADNVSANTSLTNTVVKIPLADAGVFMRDVGYSCDLVLTFGQWRWEGIAIFYSSAVSWVDFSKKNLFATPDWELKGDNSKIIAADETRGAEQIGDSFHFWSTNENTSPDAVGYIVSDVSGLSSGDGANVMEFDLLVTNLPEVKNVKRVGFFICEGISFILQDNTCANERRNAYCFGIANLEGRLTLVSDMENPECFDIGVDAQETETIHVRVEYENVNAYYASPGDFSDPNARFYVNGVFVGEDEGVKSQGNTIVGSANTLCMFAQPVVGEDLEFTLSNMTLSYLNPAFEKADDLSSLNAGDILGKNLPDMPLNANLELLEYLPGGMLNGVAIAWESSDPSILTNDGRIIPGGEASDVILTAINRSTGTTKDFRFAVTRNFVDVPHSNRRVAVDGMLRETGWQHAGRLSDGVMESISFSALWNGENLYLGIDKVELRNLSIILDGRHLDNVLAKTGTNHTELCISLDELGLEAKAGTSLPLVIELGDMRWVGVITLGEIVLFDSLQDAILVGVIVFAVILAAFLMIAFWKRDLFEKPWCVIALAVGALGFTSCICWAFCDMLILAKLLS